MADLSAIPIIESAALRRALSFARFEYVTVTFGAADTDQVIPYQTLRPSDLTAVRWVDITPGTVYNGATEDIPSLYQSSAPGRLAWGDGFLVLRSTVASYTTRLLLFLERD